MFKHSFFFAFCIACWLLPGSISAQAPPKPPDAKPGYSQEAFVIEQDSTRIAFENDGTATRESTGRVRIQSGAGVQRFGVLTFPYENSTGSVEIDYVRVRKPDGTVVSTPPDNVQDMASEITHQAPSYSDLREKHVAVKGLGVGDVLEYQIHWRVTKPLVPGQFWFSYNFTHEGIVLQEQLQISVPRDRAMKWKSSNAKPAITEEGGRRIFTWTGSNLEHKSKEQERADQERNVYQAARGKYPPPEIQISTYQSWEEVGKWYAGLQQDRVKPTPEIRAKAEELTKGASTDDAKAEAIYRYVSGQFHYISISFGVGRYQPHSAGEVLANQYGDCKDKHTLLASLLEAAGIKAYLKAGNADKALAAYQKDLELNPRSENYNNIGYALADADVKLEVAQQYAQKAVQMEEEVSTKVKLSALQLEDLGHVTSLAADWDTLAWVFHRMGNNEQAEKYLNAAWALSELGIVADRLGQIYEQQQKKQAAIRMYRLALYRFSLELTGNGQEMEKTEERLRRLALGSSKTDPNRLTQASEDLYQLENIKLQQTTKNMRARSFLWF